MTPLEAALLFLNALGLLNALNQGVLKPPETITNPAPFIQEAECEEGKR